MPPQGGARMFAGVERGEKKFEWDPFLKSAGIPGESVADYSRLLTDAGIDQSLLKDLNKEWLGEVGIKKTGHVMKILKHIDDYVKSNGGVGASAGSESGGAGGPAMRPMPRMSNLSLYSSYSLLSVLPSTSATGTASHFRPFASLRAPSEHVYFHEKKDTDNAVGGAGGRRPSSGLKPNGNLTVNFLRLNQPRGASLHGQPPAAGSANSSSPASPNGSSTAFTSANSAGANGLGGGADAWKMLFGGRSTTAPPQQLGSS